MGGGERERERQTETETDRQTQRDRQTDTEREREKERETETQRERNRQTDRAAETTPNATLSPPAWLLHYVSLTVRANSQDNVHRAFELFKNDDSRSGIEPRSSCLSA